MPGVEWKSEAKRHYPKPSNRLEGLEEEDFRLLGQWARDEVQAFRAPETQEEEREAEHYRWREAAEKWTGNKPGRTTATRTTTGAQLDIQKMIEENNQGCTQKNRVVEDGHSGMYILRVLQRNI